MNDEPEPAGEPTEDEIRDWIVELLPRLGQRHLLRVHALAASLADGELTHRLAVQVELGTEVLDEARAVLQKLGYLGG